MAEKTKNQIIQFIRDCYIPNNTNFSISQVPDIWKDEVDGSLSVSENLVFLEELFNYSRSTTQKWDDFNYQNYYEKYQNMVESYDFKNEQQKV